MKDVFEFNAYSPSEVAERVDKVGVIKARLPLLPMLMLGFLAGVFIGLGAMFYVVVQSDQSLGFATGQVLGGAAFSLGLMLVVVAGAELFTGNNLLVMAWADGKIETAELLKSWSIVCVANLFGAFGLALVVFFSGHTSMNEGGVGAQYILIAEAKGNLPFLNAFLKGVVCNVLVCLAVWMAFAGHSVVDKTIAVLFPVTAFVAAGFEHSIANMYFFPVAILEHFFSESGSVELWISWQDILRNLVAVILGNVVGGGGFVALVYYVIYLRHRKS